MKAHVDHHDVKEAQGSSAWGTKTWLFLLVSTVLIAPIALFVHDFMLETLKVPYPTTIGMPMAVNALDAVVRFLALAAMCRLARPRLQGLSRTSAALCVGLLLIMLNEVFRVFLIESAIIGNGWYSALDNTPRALSWFVGGCAVSWMALGVPSRRNAVLACVLIAVLMVFTLHPALDALGAWLKHSLPEPSPLYTDPYPFKINVLIYATFIEPTIAALVLVAFCWPALRGLPLSRMLAFTALLLLVRGRVTGLLVESFWVKPPLAQAFLSESQFFLETLTLGLLVALAWHYAMRAGHGPARCVVGNAKD